MIYFANPTSSPAVHAAMRASRLGYIATPDQGNRPIDGVVWCADNGCFGKGYPGDDAWFAWLTAHRDRAETCLFAVAPDVVADAAATLERSRPWLPRIRALGYPAAFAAQDGQETLPVPWAEFDVLFIGGSTDWKLGPAARDLIYQAHDRDLWVHMGRLNSDKRMRYASSIGVDSCDGTILRFGPDENLDRPLAWLRRANTQLTLFGDPHR